ncbi:MAG TPA: hypothetical protein VFW43_02880 [Polaromonas sp.]|nr:hypothetical protein [Polaromonas sp.]
MLDEWLKKLSSGLLNALFVPKSMAVQFASNLGLCRYLATLKRFTWLKVKKECRCMHHNGENINALLWCKN